MRARSRRAGNAIRGAGAARSRFARRLGSDFTPSGWRSMKFRPSRCRPRRPNWRPRLTSGATGRRTLPVRLAAAASAKVSEEAAFPPAPPV